MLKQKVLINFESERNEIAKDFADRVLMTGLVQNYKHNSRIHSAPFCYGWLYFEICIDYLQLAIWLLLCLCFNHVIHSFYFASGRHGLFQ
jgi:hypothetical protein